MKGLISDILKDLGMEAPTLQKKKRMQKVTFKRIKAMTKRQQWWSNWYKSNQHTRQYMWHENHTDRQWDHPMHIVKCLMQMDSMYMVKHIMHMINCNHNSTFSFSKHLKKIHLIHMIKHNIWSITKSSFSNYQEWKQEIQHE